MSQELIQKNSAQSDLIQVHRSLLLDMRRRATILHNETAKMRQDARRELSRIAAATEALRALNEVRSETTRETQLLIGAARPG